MDIKKLKKIIRVLDPYVNGRLITNVFDKYWKELCEEINSEKTNS